MKIIWSKIACAVRSVLPKVLLGHEKAIVAFVTPILLAQLARLVPSIHVSPSIMEQLVTGAVTSITVHATTNTRK